MSHYEILNDISPASLAAFDMILDVRSPAEFAEDHIPGAINLPVLNNEERALIGTIYTQDSAFLAKRRGAALVAANIARHIETALSDKPADYRILVHCWRGGMRSRAMALVLTSVGWPVSLLEGGYQTWRRAVVAGLGKEEDTHPALPLVLIDGQTGVAKTAVLKQMHQMGAQVIDLEALANHRGSVFGSHPDSPQPSQKRFETCLWDQLRDMDLDQPIYLEAESSLIGKRRIPARLWASMKNAPRIMIEAPVSARAEYLAEAYPELVSDTDRLTDAIRQLSERHSKSVIAEWLELAASKHHKQLAKALITHHYDPTYNRSRTRRNTPTTHTERVEDLSTESIKHLAGEILEEAGSLDFLQTIE